MGEIPESDFVKNLRWVTPLGVSIVGILVTILIFIVSSLRTEIREVREEVVESRKFAVQYTDKMIELILKTAEKKR